MSIQWYEGKGRGSWPFAGRQPADWCRAVVDGVEYIAGVIKVPGEQPGNKSYPAFVCAMRTSGESRWRPVRQDIPQEITAYFNKKKYNYQIPPRGTMRELLGLDIATLSAAEAEQVLERVNGSGTSRQSYAVPTHLLSREDRSVIRRAEDDVA